MRLPSAVLCAIASTSAAVACPAVAGAAPSHNHGVTINVTPKPIIAGEGVLIYGQLNRDPSAGQRVVLYHHVAGSHRGYTEIGVTTTDSHGFYEFTRSEGVVRTNRSWFTRLAGAPRTQSRTIRELVSPLVSLNTDQTNADTSQRVVFTGHVEPNHRFERVFLQQQIGSSDDWRTLKSGRLGPRSNYSFVRRFRVPGAHVLRVLFRGDHRNIRGASDPVTVTVQQAEVPDFTILSSDPVIEFGQSATISGTLYRTSTHDAEAGTPVTLCGRTVTADRFTCDTAALTRDDGSYSFSVTPVHNEVYVVKTTLAPHRHTARLFQGVRDAVTLSVDGSSSVTAGQRVTFSGSAAPEKAGDVVYLQRLGEDGDWHTVAVSTISHDSTFSFVRVFGTAGSKTFRARIPGDGENIGGASPSVTLEATLPPVSTLPRGS